MDELCIFFKKRQICSFFKEKNILLNNIFFRIRPHICSIWVLNSKPVCFIKLSKSLWYTRTILWVRPLQSNQWPSFCSELWVGDLGFFTASEPILFGKGISISTLKCKMRNVPLHATLKEERGSRFCRQAGVHHLKLCCEKKDRRKSRRLPERVKVWLSYSIYWSQQ